METANKVIVTLILCFIFLSLFMTYLAVLVRALRIKNATLKNRLETADKDVKDAYDSLDNVKAEFDLFRTQSAKIINTSTENNARLQIELNKAKEDNAKLFDIAKGADGAGNIMYVEVAAGQEAPEFKPFNSNTGEDRRFEYHESSVERSIVKCFGIPPVLAGVLEAGKLATSSELKDAYDIYNSETEPDRIVFEEQFSKLIGQPVTILPLTITFTSNAPGN